MTPPLLKKIRVTLVTADGLSKRNLLWLPNPFAVITVDGDQTKTTGVIKATLNPCWNESFDITVKDSSIVAAQVFDQRKLKRKDQGFLGEINVRVSDALDFELGGHKMLTLDLKGTNGVVVRGKLIMILSTSIQVEPISDAGTSHVAGLTTMLSESSLNGTSPSASSINLTHPDSNTSGHPRNTNSHAAGDEPRSSASAIPSVTSSVTSTTTKDQAHPENPTDLAKVSVLGTSGSISQPQSVSQLGPLPSGSEDVMVHDAKTTTWDNPRLPSSFDSNLPQYSDKLDFGRKLIYFRSQPSMQAQPGNCQFTIRRKYIFEDSYVKIMKQTPNDLKKKLMIKFEGEGGQDYDAISKEFFSLLLREVFKPEYAMFEVSAHNRYTFQIYPHSYVNPEHLGFFKFIGRVLGLGIFYRRFLDAYFIPSMYKRMLKKKVRTADLESVDPELHQGLADLLENDITDVIDETFTSTEERYGEMVTFGLKPGGANIPVTEENKQEYVDLLVEHRIYGRVKHQSDALVSGLGEVIPLDLLTAFDERELELLICGTPEIDVDDWAKFTDYRGYHVDSEVIQWFWKCVRSWPLERQSRLLQFATGTSRIPLDGFSGLQGSNGRKRFTIERSGDPSQLPMSHMCFNTIDLPPYKDYATLEQKLTLSVEETIGLQH